MSNQKYFGHANRIITASQPQQFKNLFFQQTLFYPLPSLKTHVRSSRQSYYLYHSPSPASQSSLSLTSLTTSPKALLILLPSQTIILQSPSKYTLQEYMLHNPYLSEKQIRTILSEVTESLQEYQNKNIHYDCIHPLNIVFTTKWELSLAGLVLGTHKANPQYYRNKQELSPLGMLLWCLLFNAPPRTAKPNPHQYIRQCKEASLLEIYYYFSRYLNVSTHCWSLLQYTLNPQGKIKNFLKQQFFASQLSKYQNNVQCNIKALSYFNQHHTQYNSLILAAIQYKEKYPSQHMDIGQDSTSIQQAIFIIKTHNLLKSISIPQELKNDSSRVQQISIQIPYFKRVFDAQNDYPCRQLIKMQSLNMLHAYPYAMVFELYKVVNKQPKQIQDVIVSVSKQLLQISALSGNQLYNAKASIKDFSQIKIPFRRDINHLYKHFLDLAMRKYNSKWVDQTMNQGLQYYRLCLKLMEASVLVRKKGIGLNLKRIQTADRATIQQDLNQLLTTYFSNRIQL